MSQNRVSHGLRSRSFNSRGFTLIEVLVSLIILSIGLLGLGLLQASSLRSSFSANQRTVATNLAYQMTDMMRANAGTAFIYAFIDPGDAAAQNATTCNRTPATGSVAADDSAGWMCQLVRELPGGDADVQYTPGGAGAAGIATVIITWDDTRWIAASPRTSFTVVTHL